MLASRLVSGVLLSTLLHGCGTSLCNDARDPDMAFCRGDRLDLAQAIERARGRQPELAGATVVRVTSGSLGSLDVDGRDDEWRLIFVTTAGESRTLTVRPNGVPDVRPGGAPEEACDGAMMEVLPPSVESTQNTVLHFEQTHGTFELGGAFDLELFYEHECFDAVRPRTFHVHITETTEVGMNHWYYLVGPAGGLESVCGPCDVDDLSRCTSCAAP